VRAFCDVLEIVPCAEPVGAMRRGGQARKDVVLDDQGREERNESGQEDKETKIRMQCGRPQLGRQSGIAVWGRKVDSHGSQQRSRRMVEEATRKRTTDRTSLTALSH
jgi:hypothetical protein